jgi:hypothetical protein
MFSNEIRVKALSNSLIKAGLTLSMLVAVLVLPLVLSSGISNCINAEARSKKKTSASAPSRSKSGSAKKKSSGESRHESKSSRSGRSHSKSSSREIKSSKESRRSGKSSKTSRRERERERVSSHQGKHAVRHTSKAAHGARHHEEDDEDDRKVETVVKPLPPSPELVEANSRRESSYQTMTRAYRLYDEGLNARIAGNFNSAVSKLTESSKLFNDARGYQRTGNPSLQEALVHYELGQACEGNGDILSARDSYVRCLNIRPTMVEASLRLVGMLATAGQWQLALAKASDAMHNNPNDPRVHQLMSLILLKTGHPQDARVEALRAQQLLKVAPKYKPMGIDAVWRRTHKEDGTPVTESETGVQEGDSNAKSDTGKSDVDNPDDVMGVEKDEEDDDD